MSLFSASLPVTPSFPWQQFTHPKYWPSWIGLGLLRISVFFSYPLLMRLGRLCGDLFYYLVPYRRLTASTNIELCFPELDPPSRQAMVREHFRSVGCSLFEMALSWWGSEKKLSPLLHIEGSEYLNSDKNQGTILLSAHFTDLEIGGRLLALNESFFVTFQDFRNPLFNEVMKRQRQKQFKKAISRHSIREMIRSLKAGDSVWYAMDQDNGRDGSVFVPFFGIQAATLTTTSRLAKITGAQVIPFFTQRLPNDQGYKLTILPPLSDFPSGCDESDSTQINKLIEEYIRQTPEQYLWIHRRFKTRPEGEDKLYPSKPRRVKRAKKAAASVR